MCYGRVSNAVCQCSLLSLDDLLLWYSPNTHFCLAYVHVKHFVAGSESQERGSSTCSCRPVKTVNDSQNMKPKHEYCKK
jgi:hypothetical protein